MNRMETQPTTPPSPGDAGEHRRAVAEIAELAGGLAHELRNPLSTIMIQLKLLTEDLQDTAVDAEDMRRRALLKVDSVRLEAERLQALFDEFLQLAGPCRLKLAYTDLASVLRRLAEFVEPAARQAGIRVETVLPAGTAMCRVDERLLGQALLNLVINAQQAMPQGGTLRIALTPGPQWMTLEVADTGVGIAPADQARIFRPFFSTKPHGTGLGLSITRRIVADHDGRLEFTSEQGRGSRFTIHLPVVGPPEVADPCLKDDARDPGV